LGNLEADVGFFMRGAGASTASNPDAPRQRGRGVIISALIEHPTEGLILFETGAGPDYPEVWGAPLNDLFSRVDYTQDQELDKAIEKTGHKITDVKAVIMGHLHLDHAGGLTYFRGTDIPIYVHELELKHAFYSVLTKTDFGKLRLVLFLDVRMYSAKTVPSHRRLHPAESSYGFELEVLPWRLLGVCAWYQSPTCSGPHPWPDDDAIESA
jgi:glyoxylase-like metal-dependent hydrolase (beta-lactamase superfamily II)